jgi:hypothetical protein
MRRRSKKQAVKATMSKSGSKQGKNFSYPDQTKGSETAAQIRKETNGLSEHKREELFQRGMQIIYGGSGKKETVRSRH